MRVLSSIAVATALATLTLGCSRTPTDIAAPETTTTTRPVISSTRPPAPATTSTTSGPTQTACERAIDQKYGTRVLSSAEMKQWMADKYKCNFSVFDDSLNYVKCEEFRNQVAAKSARGEKILLSEVLGLMPDGTDCTEYPSK